MPQADKVLAAYNRQFKARGTNFKLLCRCRSHILILVYDEKLLAQVLQRQISQNYLKRCGYNKNISTGEFLNALAAKISYPPEDIEGFKRYKGRNFKCCGYWKVYGNAERAQKLFDAYTLCRDKLMRALQTGATLKVAAAAI